MTIESPVVRTERGSEHEHLASTIVTMQLGVCLAVLLSLMFFSGGLFFLFAFNYDVGPYFTITRVIHFYAGLTSIPFLLAKYGSTTFRLAGYYLRLPRFKKAGPPRLVPRIMSPLLALDFFVLYFSGLYLIFHYYYTVANIPPFNLRPGVLHTWAAVVAVPLLAIHLGWHLFETARGLDQERRELRAETPRSPESRRRVLERRAFVGTVLGGGLGLAFALQNTPLAHKSVHGLFIGRVPEEEKGGPGGFPTETLFGLTEDLDLNAWRLQVNGAVGRELSLSYDQLLALPPVSQRIRLSCVSGWSTVREWRGPLLRDVLALALADGAAKTIDFHSVTNRGYSWHRKRLNGDKTILATHVNGEPLSNKHGFPVRLILPGYPGQNMIKQLDRITVRPEAVTFEPEYHLSLRGAPADGCCLDGPGSAA